MILIQVYKAPSGSVHTNTRFSSSCKGFSYLWICLSFFNLMLFLLALPWLLLWHCRSGNYPAWVHNLSELMCERERVRERNMRWYDQVRCENDKQSWITHLFAVRFLEKLFSDWWRLLRDTHGTISWFFRHCWKECWLCAQLESWIWRTLTPCEVEGTLGLQ